MNYPLVTDQDGLGIPVTEWNWDDAHVINAALDVRADDPAFWYKFIADELTERHHNLEPGAPVRRVIRPRSAVHATDPPRRGGDR
ncbi:hypothetical protein MB46_06785 [Arthrobacter alpinus]|nr:hypothetical protein MB46_06785 [Arthrobacter alpinus]